MKTNSILLILASVGFVAACGKTGFSSSQGNAVPLSGNSTAGIVGGTAVAPDDPLSSTTVQVFSFNVTTQNGQQVIESVASCTSTILTNDIVISAAHCTNVNPNYMILYFSDDVIALQNFQNVSSPDQLRDIVSSNPNFRRVVGGMTTSIWPQLTPTQAANWGDLSLLKFSGGLPDGYQPASLLPAAATLTADEPIELAGFGLKNGKRDTESQDLRKVFVTILDPNYSDTEMSLDTNAKKGSCHGDSGGPGYVDYNGQAYVAGITSRADMETDPKGQCVGHVIYTKVQPYLTWIAQSIQTLEDPNYQMAPIPQPNIPNM